MFYNRKFNVCFLGHQVMSNVNVLDDCECPNDCNRNHYTYSMSSKKLDINDICIGADNQ